jgi:transcriptional regulator with XRE-family HTH domain
LAACEVGVLFRWLNQHGWSQVQIANATGQSQPEVSAIMKGRKVTAHSVLLRIARGLHIPLGYMRLSSCTVCEDDPPDGRAPETEEESVMLRRRFLAAAGAIAAGGVAIDGMQRLLPSPVDSVRAVPDRVGATEVAQVRATTAQLRTLDYQYGRGTTLDAACGFAGWGQRLLGARLSRSTACDLRTALADLEALIAYALHDCGRAVPASRHHLQALMLAREAEEPALVGTILGDMARVSVDTGDPREGIRLAGYGLLACEDNGTTPAVRAGLRLEEAWARAHLGDERGVCDALDRAAGDLADTDPTLVHPNASTARHLLNGSSHAGWRGRVYVELSRTPALRRYAGNAVEEAASATAAYDGWRSRTVTGHVMDRLVLATGLLRAGVPDEGVTAANEVLDAAAALASSRVSVLLADISDAAAPYAGNTGAEDLRSHIAALTAA